MVACDCVCSGTRVILEAFRDAGVAVEQLVVAGGLVKNAFLMQLYRRAASLPQKHAHHVTFLCSDVTRLSLSIIACDYGAALGSCIHAAVAAAAYPSVAAAADRMGRIHRDVYQPNEARALEYDALFAECVIPTTKRFNADYL
jgi:L-ribulokinase